MSPTATTPRLSPEELAELIRRERAKGNPLALFSGTCEEEPKDGPYWQGIYECRRLADVQQAEFDALEASENQK